ncbi:MAG: BREX-1 system phosphatase PglZ type A [Parasporobacterium sp.]|nr:BREX-1 system phosphatase PglZ type A [Parasporobacterium sp.]
MNLIEIQEIINEMLTGNGRQLVFWYDDDASYEETVHDFELTDDAKLWILTDNNWFETKVQIEERDPNGNYLIYAPFPRPDDRENCLADIFYYSKHFYSDKLVQIMGDLNIPASCQDEVKRFRRFWTAGNTEKFQKLEIEDITKEKLHLGILCVLAGIKTLSFDEMLKKVVLAGTEDNAILKKMESLSIDRIFWGFCEKDLGYKDPTPTITKLLCTMIVTYMDTVTGGNIPSVWKTFLSGRQNDAVVFVKNLMNNDESKEFYDSFAGRMSVELNAASMIRQIRLEDVLECDALPDFDENLLSWMIAKIEDNMLDEKVAGLGIPQICEERIKPCNHYNERFSKQYRMIYHAWQVLKGVSLHSFKPTLDEVVSDYTETTYQIDRHYRKFYYYMDAVGLTPETEKMRDLVENVYTNKYLTDFSYKWNQILTDGIYTDYTGRRQEQFYQDYVRPFMHEDGRDGRVIVIISDGLRYECGRELFENLELDEKCMVRMSHMLSVLPSETTLGMASLLPNKDILVDTDLNITVDGMKCGNSTVDRQKILQSRNPRSICVDFDRLMTAKQSEIRDLLQDKDVVYVYQNQIDQRGEGGRSENEVFNACEEAVQEIQTMIHRLTGYVSATRFLVTADHGFIYKRDKLTESDKISINKSDVPKKNYRYLLSQKKYDDNEALISRSMAYLSALNQLYVTTPKGTDIIKKQAGGMNYVHGGSSLQEMIIPVIKVITAKGKQDTGYVKVEISSFISRITNTEFKLDFMQMSPVTEKNKPRKLVAFFVDEIGKKISFDVPIIANIRDKDASKRLITEKFTLRSGKYRAGQDYYLILADMDDESQIHQKYKFTIDIAEI